MMALLMEISTWVYQLIAVSHRSAPGTPKNFSLGWCTIQSSTLPVLLLGY